MDAIDITDSAFSLDGPIVNPVNASDSFTDYTMFIYIGVAIVVSFITIFVYKYYNTKSSRTNDSELDCPAGFCNMDVER